MVVSEWGLLRVNGSLRMGFLIKTLFEIGLSVIYGWKDLPLVSKVE